MLNRTSDSHKGDYGRAFCVVGSYGMAGAAILSAKACLRCGVGICELCLADKIYPIVASNVHEAVYSIYSSHNDVENALERGLEKATVVLMGCGMGQNEITETALKYLLKNARIPLVIDADGINLLKAHINVLGARTYPTLITPHLGEMSRLSGFSVEYVKQNKAKIASEFAEKYGVTVVLKDHETVVASPSNEIYFNQTGNAGMATGGSGDVLAGMITSFLAQGYNPYDSAVASVYLHGASGDMAAEEKTVAAMLPTDMIEILPKVFKKLFK